MFPLAAIAAGVAALAILTARAAHAVAEALVQVTNTAANPAVTRDTAHQASQIVFLTTLAQATNNGDWPFGLYLFGGEVIPNYTVPSGQALVVTAIDISSGCAGVTGIQFSDSGGQFTTKVLSASGPAGTITHLTYPSGMVFRSGLSPSMINRGSSCYVQVDMHGYLTAN